MTIEAIQSVGIIGGGPGGLAALYEFLHLDTDGKSTVGSKEASNPRFPHITVFEQKDKAGGIWAPTKEADLPVPPQEILDTEKYSNPDVIHPQQPIPEELSNSSTGFTFEKPFVKKGNKLADELEWKRSGVYPDLFTNIPSRFTRFSYFPIEKKFEDKSRKIYPFLTQGELSQSFEDFIERESLAKYIRFNSRVEEVTKNAETGKWLVTVRKTSHEGGENVESWYQQEFDAIVVANGHYTVPNFPTLEGLSSYSKRNPGKIIHAKSYRDQDTFKDKKVLIVGGSISTANLVQYIFPVAKELYISRRGPHLVFPWIDKGLESEGITTKPTIKEITSDDKIIFSDGTEESGFDIILFSTGYHYHYPFLKKYLEVRDPSNLSRVNGLYHDTFSIEDPTLAITGVAISGINFHSIEASVAAIAGVWSGLGKKPLPSKEEQKKWSQKRIDDTNDNLFYHYYNHATIKEDFVDPLFEYAPTNRYNPLEEDWKFKHEIDEGIDHLEKLFYKLKQGELTVLDTTKNIL